MATKRTPQRTPKYHVPQAQNDPPVDQSAEEGGHPHAGIGKFLRCLKTGTIYAWTEKMAERGDLVEATDEGPNFVKPKDDDPVKDLSFLSEPPDKVMPHGPTRAA